MRVKMMLAKMRAGGGSRRPLHLNHAPRKVANTGANITPIIMPSAAPSVTSCVAHLMSSRSFSTSAGGNASSSSNSTTGGVVRTSVPLSAASAPVAAFSGVRFRAAANRKAKGTKLSGRDSPDDAGSPQRRPDLLQAAAGKKLSSEDKKMSQMTKKAEKKLSSAGDKFGTAGKKSQQVVRVCSAEDATATTAARSTRKKNHKVSDPPTDGTDAKPAIADRTVRITDTHSPSVSLATFSSVPAVIHKKTSYTTSFQIPEDLNPGQNAVNKGGNLKCDRFQ